MKCILSLTAAMPLVFAGSALAQSPIVSGSAVYPNYGRTVTRTTIETPNLQPGAPGIAGTSTIIGTPTTTTRSYVTYGNQWVYPSVPTYPNTVPSYPYNGYRPSPYPYSVPLANPNRFSNPPSVTVIPLGNGGYNYCPPAYGYPAYPGYPAYGYNYPVNGYPNPNCGTPYPVYVQPNTVVTLGNTGFGAITQSYSNTSSGWGVTAGSNGISVGINGGQTSYNSQTTVR